MVGDALSSAPRSNKRIPILPINEAAWMVKRHARLQVKPAPYTEPAADEIVVRNRAIAINPVDWALQYMGGLMFNWIKYPVILGSDVAGEVVAVGSGVTRVKVGDRVLAMAAGGCKQRNRAAEGAFQAYSIVLDRMTTVIPDALPFVEAAVVPLGLTTAACGLFQSDLLALELPSAARTPRGQWVIITGGATSVGSNAIQLAAAAGYGVVTTCSPKNVDYVKALGADHAFDYRSKDLVRSMVGALAGKEVAGVLAIGVGSVDECLDTLSQCRGRKFIASCSSPIPFEMLGEGQRITLPILLKVAPVMLGANARMNRKSRRLGIPWKFYDASSLVDNPVGRYIYQDYLGAALASGQFRPAPPPRIVGSSLRDLQSAMDIQRKGVSAAKIVVTLE